LPFDTARAQALYQTLFGKVEDLIRDKHLLIVPSGPLTQFSFQVLVTAKPDNARDYRSVQWLPRKHALTVLPAVSALRALRRVTKASATTKPMIGFGNPLLDGDPAALPWGGKVGPNRARENHLSTLAMAAHGWTPGQTAPSAEVINPRRARRPPPCAGANALARHGR
jgi:hypothetical protein